MKKFAKIAIMFLLLSSFVFADEIVIITNKSNSKTTISKADLKRIYVGRKKNFGDLLIVPINQDLNTGISNEFLSKFVKKTSAEYKIFWIDQLIKGKGVSPMQQKTADQVKKVVAQVPGAIGYIYKSELDDTVKVLVLD